MTRVFVAGFHHETNTFAPAPADWAAFTAGSGYPPYRRGAAMLDALRGAAVALGGFAAAAEARGWTLVPSVWAGAVPSNRVTRDAFERIAGEIVADLRAAAPVAAVYLDLHGAAVAEHVDDAEGELLARVRAVVGAGVAVLASLDLHANVTARMLGHASAMSAFRSYPHVDMRETGARVAAMLARRLVDPRPYATCARRVPFLLPLNAQCTLVEPAAGLVARLAALEAVHGVELNFAMGFAAADFAECGPVVFGHGPDAAAVQAAVDALHAEVLAARDAFRIVLPDADAAVAEALAAAHAGAQPVVIADTQDNPGAGGEAATTGLLHALRRAGAGRAFPGRVAVGLLCDPEAAAAAHAAGVGATLELQLGRSVRGFDGRRTEPPLAGRFRVEQLHAGTLALHGPMTAGTTAVLGPCARLRSDDGIDLLVASAKAQTLDLDLLRFLGCDPAAMAIVVVKSSVHFRAAFAPVAARIVVARAPGPMAADPAELPWTRLPATLARRP